MEKEKMKRIALIVPTLSNGGAEKVAADLSIYFYGKGYKVFFFLTHNSSLSDYLYKGEINYVNICSEQNREWRWDKKLYFLLYDIINLRKEKRKNQIDISISFMPICNFFNILSKCGDRVFVSLHNVVSERKEMRGTVGCSKFTFMVLYQLADRIIFVSQYCQNDWRVNYGDFLKKTKTIYNPINRLRKDKIEDLNVRNFNKNNPIIISVARLDGVKQPWHLIRVFAEIVRKYSNAQLYLLGDGILKNTLREMCEILGISEQVHFQGFVNNVEEYLQQADVFVLTSASEAFGCAMVEAMRNGVPIVANDCPGGVREIMQVHSDNHYEKCNIETKYGYITPRLDGKKYRANESLSCAEMCLANAIECILKDEELRNKMQEQCQKRAQDFELRKIGAMWEKELNMWG